MKWKRVEKKIEKRGKKGGGKVQIEKGNKISIEKDNKSPNKNWKKEIGWKKRLF